MNLETGKNKGSRLLALDAFRGITIAFMILVNTPGSWSSVYSPLLHAKWHGATLTDLVFPFFLFIVGVSMFFSLSRYGQEFNKTVILKIVKRVFLIFLIGLTLNFFPFFTKNISELRIMGVLQRIALAYGIAAFCSLFIPKNKLLIFSFLILILYWAVLFFWGGADPYTLDHNIVRWVDLKLLGENHVYHGFGIPFDPEGLLSTVPASINVIFGYLAGHLIKSHSDKNILVKKLLLSSAFLTVIAFIFDVYFPINKPLWTSSYVLYTCGIACVVIAILIELIDIRGYDTWTKPFVVFGTNPLVIYVLSGVLVKVMIYIVRWESVNGTTNLYGWLFRQIFLPPFDGFPKFASLLFALFIVLVCWSFGLLLYRKKIFLKV